MRERESEIGTMQRERELERERIREEGERDRQTAALGLTELFSAGLSDGGSTTETDDEWRTVAEETTVAGASGATSVTVEE